MSWVEKVLLILHFVGLASLLGGFLVQMSATTRVVNPAMLHGALTQLVTGIALVGVLQAENDPANPVNNTKVAVKLLVLLVILGLIVANRKKESVSTGVWGAIGGLTLVNVGVAVLWT
jgi:hypothetical protein